MDEADKRRFMSKVERRGPDDCWPWQAGCGSGGYGSFWLEGRSITAHRVAFFIANGKWPEPFGCHDCDNPPCCNPAHVFEGTQLENDMDRVAKGRSARGAQHGRHTKPARTARGKRAGVNAKPESYPRGSDVSWSKLSDAKVREMRSLTGLSQNALAARYGISRGTVRDVLSGRAWRHVIP